jgi:hypothetical protein
LLRSRDTFVPVLRKPASVGFAFNTADRVEYSKRSIASITADAGFDVIWVDGSKTEEGRNLPGKTRPGKSRVREVHYNIRGGPDNAIQFSLQRLLDLGYDYCGLIENDIVFRPGWFSGLLNTIGWAGEQGLSVGAATVRNFESRVLEYCGRFTLNWCMGAGMALFSRKAAELILRDYAPTSVRELFQFYADLMGVHIRSPELLDSPRPVSRLYRYMFDINLPPDWRYSMTLYRHKLVSVGSIPSYAFDDAFDPRRTLRTNYASPTSARETFYVKVGVAKREWIRVTNAISRLLYFKSLLQIIEMDQRSKARARFKSS